MHNSKYNSIQLQVLISIDRLKLFWSMNFHVIVLSLRIMIIFITNMAILTVPMVSSNEKVYAALLPAQPAGDQLGSIINNEYNSLELDQMNPLGKQRLLRYMTTGVYEEPTLEEKYSVLAEEQFYANIIPYLPQIDKVLVEKGVDSDSRLVKVMFYVGQRESGWGQYRISSYLVGNEHPTGVFQFLPSTFRSVSDAMPEGRTGDIFNVEDQVRAFVAMMERGRVDEYHVMYQCNYAPCLTNDLKEYAFNYPYKRSVYSGQSKDVKKEN